VTSAPPSRYPIEIDGETAAIGTAAELAVALDVLQGQHDREVLRQLAPHLTEIIATPLDLLSTMRSLAPGDQLYLIEVLAPCLAGLIGDARHLRDLLATLADEAVEGRLLATLGEAGLRHLATNAAELSESLQWVYGSNDLLVLELLGADYVRRLLATSHDLSLVLHAIDESTQAWLLGSLGWERVVALVVDGRGLAHLLRALPASLGQQLLARYSPQRLVEIIGNARDWDYLCRRLEPAESAALYEMLGVQADA
jgi:hypothetical protein